MFSLLHIFLIPNSNFIKQKYIYGYMNIFRIYLYMFTYILIYKIFYWVT